MTLRISAANRTTKPGRRGIPARRRNGAVLLEVVLALILFVAAATIVTSGLSSSVDSLDRLRFQAHAANLAVSVLSELQLGVRPLDSAGPEPFEAPFEAWTWEVLVTGLDDSEKAPLRQVEIVVRQPEQQITHRLQALLPVRPAAGEGATTSSDAASGWDELDWLGF